MLRKDKKKRKHLILSNLQNNLFNYHDLKYSLIEFINKSGVFSDIIKGHSYLDSKKKIPKFDELKNSLIEANNELDIIKGFKKFLELFDFLYMDDRLKYFLNIDLRKNLENSRNIVDLGYILLKIDSFCCIFNSFKLQWKDNSHEEWKKKLLKGIGILNEFSDIKWITDSYTIFKYEEEILESASFIDKILQNGNYMVFYNNLMNMIHDKNIHLKNGLYDSHIFNDMLKNINIEHFNRDTILYDICSKQNILKNYFIQERNKKYAMNNHDSRVINEKYKNYMNEYFVRSYIITSSFFLLFICFTLI